MNWKKLIPINKKTLAVTLGLLLFIFSLSFEPFSLSAKATAVFSVALLMICWWLLEAIPLAITAVLPLILFPALKLYSIKEVAKHYADPTIFLFMGGFFLGIAIEKWNLHKRIALNIIKLTGFNGNRIILGFILSCGFLSLWLSNSATTIMMFPIAISVINLIHSNSINQKDKHNFSLALMLSIAYASNFAVGTIIGTPPNIAYVNYIADTLHYDIAFTKWMILFVPLTIILLLLLYVILVKWLYPNHIGTTAEGKIYLNEEIKKLGRFSPQEKKVGLVFIITVLCWILKDFLNSIQQTIQLDDSIIALTGAALLFIIPSGNKDKKNFSTLLTWDDTSKMTWDILILLGGGLALAKGLEEAKLMNQLGQLLSSYSTHNTFLLILIVAGISIFLSELISNIAQVLVMAPVITSLAISQHIDPLLLGIPMTLGASCASMLPMGTPPNAIVYASGFIKMKEMYKAGFILNILCAIIIALFCYLLQPLILKLN